jgi:hypothetical protein
LRAEAVTLAKTTGAAILPTFTLRGPHGTSRVVIEPPIQVHRDLDREVGVEQSFALHWTACSATRVNALDWQRLAGSRY